MATPPEPSLYVRTCGWLIALVYTIGWMIALAVLQETDSLWHGIVWDAEGKHILSGYTFGPGSLWVPTLVVFVIVIVGILKSASGE